MEMQNITLSLPKKILRKIKLIAVQRQTSVSRLLTQVLEDLANEETEYLEAARRIEALMQEGFDLGLSEQKPASREELHDRKY